MYGHKTTDGEHYYTDQRLYIEVNDTTFCDRPVFEFFCNLRLADNINIYYGNSRKCIIYFNNKHHTCSYIVVL